MYISPFDEEVRFARLFYFTSFCLTDFFFVGFVSSSMPVS